MEFSKKFPKYGLPKSIIMNEKKGYANSIVEVYDFYVKEYVHIIIYRTIGCFQDGVF